MQLPVRSLSLALTSASPRRGIPLVLAFVLLAFLAGYLLGYLPDR
ncbi:hypothetical protein [Lewinella sp. IMCC34183]|nr:hypothetical protein [Lewinella sp. IMCC34183]